MEGSPPSPVQRTAARLAVIGPSKQVRLWSTTVILGILGGLIAVVLFGRSDATVGPFDVTLSARPALGGSTQVDLAPLGTLSLATHHGPTRLGVRIDRIDLARGQQLLDSPDAVETLEKNASAITQDAVTNLAVKSLGLAFVGGFLLALVRRPRLSNAFAGAGAAVIVVGASFALAATTLNKDALAEPRFTGLLALAPQAIGDVRDVTKSFGLYRTQVNDLVANLSRLYETANATSTVNVNDSSTRILHVSDLHLNPAGFDLIQQLVTQFKPAAIIDTGDINDWGTSFEGSFADRISRLGVPYIFIRGNHDSTETQAAVAAQANAIVLDNTTTEVDGIRIWGIGDPRYTPDKETAGNLEAERATATQTAPQVLAGLLSHEPPMIDVALVHDPATAVDLGGHVPLVLAGHLHTFTQRQLGTSVELIEGSTGAAGLRGVTEAGSTPLSASVLYFDKASHGLIAYDHVTVQGLGGSGAQIDRHIMNKAAEGDTTTTSTTESSVPTTPAAAPPASP